MSAPKKSYWEKKLATIAFYSRPIFCSPRSGASVGWAKGEKGRKSRSGFCTSEIGRIKDELSESPLMFVEANIQVSWPDWQELPVTSLLCAHRQNATQPSTGMTARVSSTNVTSRMSLAAGLTGTNK